MGFKKVSEKRAMLQGVHLYYVKIAEPGTKYQSTDKQYSVNALLKKEDVKEYLKIFSKARIQKLEADEFKEKFRTSAPYEANMYYVVAIKADLNEFNAPGGKFPVKVYEPVGGKVKDITKEKLVGNGSVGDISIYINETKSFGTHPKLEGVLVKELVTFIGSGSSNPFGEEVEPSNPFGEEDPVSSVGDNEVDDILGGDNADF